jgi:hypothetical protein
MDEAKVVVRGWEDAGAWDGSRNQVPTRITIDDAVTAFLAIREG